MVGEVKLLAREPGGELLFGQCRDIPVNQRVKDRRPGRARRAPLGGAGAVRARDPIAFPRKRIRRKRETRRRVRPVEQAGEDRRGGLLGVIGARLEVRQPLELEPVQLLGGE